MSVLIKGMEMPESCFQCWFLHVINPGYFYCFASGEEFEENFAIHKGRYKDCPLVEVPTPHGRLIDADALGGHDEEERAHNETVDVVKQSGCGSPTHIYYSAYYDGVLTMTGKIRFAPTIIEAEDNDED